MHPCISLSGLQSCIATKKLIAATSRNLKTLEDFEKLCCDGIFNLTGCFSSSLHKTRGKLCLRAKFIIHVVYTLLGKKTRPMRLFKALQLKLVFGKELGVDSFWWDEWINVPSALDSYVRCMKSLNKVFIKHQMFLHFICSISRTLHRHYVWNTSFETAKQSLPTTATSSLRSKHIQFECLIRIPFINILPFWFFRYSSPYMLDENQYSQLVLKEPFHYNIPRASYPKF